MLETGESLRCPGMRDLLWDEMERFHRLEQAFRETCLAWGYQEIHTPSIEYLHLFTASGTLSPQMLSRVYSFLDWDGWTGERVVLRPDATIPAVRLFRERLHEKGWAKLFYTQNVFRFTAGDQPREVWQCGAELIGDAQPTGDLELALIGIRVLERLGLGPVSVRLSHPGLVKAALARTGLSQREQMEIYDALIEAEGSAIRRMEEAAPELEVPLRLLFDVGNGGSAYLINLRAALTASLPEALGPLDELIVIAGAIQALGCTYHIDVRSVGPFEYYTGPVFQLEARGKKVGGGGRYDHLVGLVGGGGDLPATGFALDMGALIALMDPGPPPGAGIAVVPEDRAQGLAAALITASAFQQAGFVAHVVARAGAGAGRWEVQTRSVQDSPQYLLIDLSSSSQRRFEDISELIEALRGYGSD